MKGIHTAYLGFLLAAIVLIAGLWWFNQGYGEISPKTYQYSKALCSACLNKSEVHLSKVREMLANEDVLPAKERSWIDAIVADADDGNWERAARKARRMMEDQVQY